MSPSDRLTKLGLNPTENVVHNDQQYNTFTEPPILMAKERNKTLFPIREMTYYLDGGKEKTEKLEDIMTSLERDPLFSNDDWYDLNKDQLREVTLKRVSTLSRYIENESEEIVPRIFSITGLVDSSVVTRTGVHYGLFFNAVRGSGSQEQFTYWVAQGAGNLRRFFGCFAMTELGHGSNVAGLETTALFDQKSDEFVINTPHVGATKWWIGGAAHTATHCVCFARLIINRKDHGVKSFVVPLRNVEDHTLKSGIAIGDLGKKMGRDGIDNGWIQFSKVRIPRQFMLMKHTKVDRNGVVTQPPLAQLAYGALISGRVMMASDSFQFSKKFLTIAIRYAAIRRQFSSTEGEPETVLLDYTYHQRRLIPRLAYTFAIRAGSEELVKMFNTANKKMSQLKPEDKQGLENIVEDVKELFSVSAGVKAFCTWATADIIDQCRQACGGHGYSGYNGFGQAFADWVVQCTWEGDNNVLTLSAGRSLIQSGLAARKGKRVGSVVSYLNRSDELKSKVLNGRDIRDPKVIVEAWEGASALAINRAVDLFADLTKNKKLNLTQAMEELSQQRFEIARIHTRLYLISSFFSSIEREAKGSLKPVLYDLAILFGLWSIENDAACFLTSGYLTRDDLTNVTSYVNDYCKKVREQAIGLTDSFNLSDFFINAPIGNYDGNAYKHYFEKIVRRNPIRDSKAPYHDELIKPFLHRPEDDEIDLSELE